ncbi:MAG: F-type H+-transporting ATPase subunit gamma [Paraglaciecola sp.]|jgi:F-type H+-transporting ATPase subunit gamma
MSTSMPDLQRKMRTASDLKSVVRTMKAMAAASITQYENAVLSLDDYYRTVQLALSACFSDTTVHGLATSSPSYHFPQRQKAHKKTQNIGAIVFGSDQGLVGQFNDTLANFVTQELASYQGHKHYWAVGERIQARLSETKLIAERSFALPNTLDSITPLVAELLLETYKKQELGEIEQIYLFYNQPKSKASYFPVCQKLLPLDRQWQHKLQTTKWPTTKLPQLLNSPNTTLRALVHEYLFVSIFRACSGSLASENASRLVAMQRAEKNIEELQDKLQRSYHYQRQSSIDEELFDLVGGFEALTELNE